MRVTKSQRRGSVKMVVVVVVGGGMVLGCWSLFVYLKKKIGVLRVKIIQIWEVLIVILRWICIIFVLMGKCITLRIAFQNYKLSWEIIWNMRGRWFGLQYKWSAQTSVFFFFENFPKLPVTFLEKSQKRAGIPLPTRPRGIGAKMLALGAYFKTLCVPCPQKNWHDARSGHRYGLRIIQFQDIGLRFGDSESNLNEAVWPIINRVSPNKRPDAAQSSE